MIESSPLYVAFEGGEGSGKSTQAMLLADRLGESAIRTIEPGGTDLGQKLREILLSPATGELDPMTEVYLMAADRAEHMRRIVTPQLAARRHVISDRSFGSSVAYQGAGRDLGAKRVLDVNLNNPSLVLPDMMLILEPPSDEELARRLNRDLDRFEGAGALFHKKVSDCFSKMADILASDDRTSGIKVITIASEAGGQPKSVDELNREIILEIEDFCDTREIPRPL